MIGEGTTGMGSNSAVIGNGSITDIYFGMTTSCTNGVACGPGMTAANAGAGGSVVLHAANFNSFSDMRLKKDIQDSDLGLDFIEKLRPVSYYLKAGNPLLSYGFIAQEVEKALSDRTTSMVTQENDDMKTWELNYSSIIAPVVKAIQEQQQEISADKANTLKKDTIYDQEISDLKQLIDAQQTDIEELKQQIRDPAAARAHQP